MTNSHILNIPYGQQVLNIHLPGSRIPDLVRYREETVKPSTQSILEALRQPIGTPGLKELARGRNQAIVLISDSSRLSPSSVFLPHLLRELNDAGLKDEQITVIVALGMHRKQTEEELQQLVGPDLYRRIKVLNHSALPEDCVRVGRTRQGTPIEINRRVVEADLRIATGNVEPHRLVGISGGVKALIPALNETIPCRKYSRFPKGTRTTRFMLIWRKRSKPCRLTFYSMLSSIIAKKSSQRLREMWWTPIASCWKRPGSSFSSRSPKPMMP